MTKTDNTSPPTRRLGNSGPAIPAIGLGLMGLGIDCYGEVGTDEQRFALLDRAYELGCINWDTSDVYGDSEDLVGKWFKMHPERRKDIFLATKFALTAEAQDDGSYKGKVDSSPEYCKQACEQSLGRLGVECIDLYYVHRVDTKTPIEKTIQALVELKNEGKIKYLGLSEVSSDTLRRAHAIHPISAVQVEYNPWALETEGPVSKYLLRTCRELGVATFAYSPLGRGILTGQYQSSNDLSKGDYRNNVAQFQGENLTKNLRLVDKFKEVAERKSCTPSQLALAWLLAQGDDIFPIPGTKRIKYLDDNWASLKVKLSDEETSEIRKFVNEIGVAGERDVAFNQYADTPSL